MRSVDELDEFELETKVREMVMEIMEPMTERAN